MKKLFKEFKEFISRGNVLDLAVGMIIGAAFSAIVKSLVADIIMPLVGRVVGGELSQWKFVLKEAIVDLSDSSIILEPEIAITYGNFIQVVIDFLLIALTLFIIIKIVAVMANQRKKYEEQYKKKNGESVVEEPVVEEPVVVPPSEEVVLLTQILEELQKQKK